MLSKFFLFLRHAIALVRADKLFSAIYIAGTAVAIASAMVIAIVMNILLADIAPEVNRSRTLYTYSRFIKDSKSDKLPVMDLSTEAIDSCFKKMQCVEAVAGLYSLYYQQNFVVNDVEYQHAVGVQKITCNPDFFRLYEFRFVSGRPFSEKEFRNGEHVCVITDKVAKALGITLKGDGSSLFLNDQSYRVVGVLKETSKLMRNSAADIYLPYRSDDFINNPEEADPDISYSGYVDARILLKKGFTRQDFLDEFEPLRKHYEAVINSKLGERVMWVFRANSHLHNSMWFGGKEENKISQVMNFVPPVLLMLLFLLLPAINLSGLVTNRMEARCAEMGIRKAFGAKRHKLLHEVLFENLVLTLLGGAVGWLLSWLFIWSISENPVFVKILTYDRLENANISIDFQMFFTPTLFIVCFLCCALLNHMAAFMPAWRSLRKPIVESLNQKR